MLTTMPNNQTSTTFQGTKLQRIGVELPSVQKKKQLEDINKVMFHL